MAKMTLNKLIKELKELKNNGVWENDIPTIQNLVIDYQNDQQTRGLDDFLYYFVSEEQVLDAVAYKAGQYDFWGVQNLIEGLERADRYKDTGDSFENITDADVEERLDNIIRQAEYYKKDAK